VFAAHVAHANVEPASLERHGADLYLACACAAGDVRALTWFDEHVLAPAAAAARGVDAADAFQDEVRQRVRAQLLVGEDGAARLGAYAGRGPLRAWVGVTAVRVALMMKRSQQRRREVPDEVIAGALALASTGNPELDLLKRQYATAFETALRAACAELEPRLRGALRMHFADGLSIDEIGAAYGVHRATAARWVQRASDTLFDATRAKLAQELSLSQTELDRVATLVRSQLDVSLSQLLG